MRTRERSRAEAGQKELAWEGGLSEVPKKSSLPEGPGRPAVAWAGRRPAEEHAPGSHRPDGDPSPCGHFAAQAKPEEPLPSGRLSPWTQHCSTRSELTCGKSTSNK